MNEEVEEDEGGSEIIVLRPSNDLQDKGLHVSSSPRNSYTVEPTWESQWL